MIDWSEVLRTWFIIAQLAWNIGIAIYLIWERRKNRALKKFEDACGQIAENEKAIILIQSELKNLPSQRQFENLGMDINKLTKALGKVEGRLEGLNRVADLMNQFLIEQGGKKGG